MCSLAVVIKPGFELRKSNHDQVLCMCTANDREKVNNVFAWVKLCVEGDMGAIIVRKTLDFGVAFYTVSDFIYIWKAACTQWMLSVLLKLPTNFVWKWISFHHLMIAFENLSIITILLWWYDTELRGSYKHIKKWFNVNNKCG